MDGQGGMGNRFRRGLRRAAPERMQRGLRRGAPAGACIIAVHSGKGGVGKTFVATNLAVSLAKAGRRVGLLDADIDCPNILKSLNLKGKLVANADRKIVPLEKYGIKIVSMAPLMATEDESLLWRGPRTSRAVEQLVHDTDWGELEYLIVDVPPGTSDVPISVLQILEGVQLLIVTTPQELALMDARRSARMAQRLNVPLLGIVENMAGDVFGQGGGEALAAELDVPFWGSIPLKASYAHTDEPASLSDPTLRKQMVAPLES